MAPLTGGPEFGGGTTEAVEVVLLPALGLSDCGGGGGEKAFAGVGQCTFPMADRRFAVLLGAPATPAPVFSLAGGPTCAVGVGIARSARGAEVGAGAGVLGLGEAG